MNRIIFCFCVFMICWCSASAETWYHGYVVLKSNQKLRGELVIQHEYDVVLFRLGSEITVLPAYKVELVSIYDEQTESIREFVSIQLAEGVASAYRFFEKIVPGAYTVLRRQHAAWYSVHLDVVDYDYFITDVSGQIFPMSKFRKKIYPQLNAATQGKLKEYVRANKLSLGRLVDSILIIRQYNYLQPESSPLAKN